MAAFSWQRVPGVEPRLGVEMRSTGEVAAFGPHEALPLVYLEALQSAGLKLPMASGSEPLIAVVLMPLGTSVQRQQTAMEVAMSLEAQVTVRKVRWRDPGIPCELKPLQALAGAAWFVDLSQDPLRPEQTASCATELRQAAVQLDLGLVLHPNQALLLAQGLAARRGQRGGSFQGWNHQQYLEHLRATRAAGSEL